MNADSAQQKQLWLLFPSRDEELSFFYQIKLRKLRNISGVNFTQGQFANLEVFSFVIGIGIEAQHFCLKLQELIVSKSFKPPWLVLIAGFAGGCKIEQKTGDLFLVDRLLVDSQTISISSAFSFNLLFLKKNSIQLGHCATVDKVVDSDTKIKLGTQGADLVEMELKLVHTIFFNLKINLICLRIILDGRGYSIPEGLANCMNRGRLQIMPLFFLILSKPWLLFSVVQLERRSRIAKKRLGTGLHLLINECNLQNR